MDWSNVEKGTMRSVYDPNRLTEEAKKAFEETRKGFGVEARMGRHGTEAYHVPHGICITVEKARKTERWLKPDKPWETDISGGDVIYDEGKFRCWYSASLAKQKKEMVYAAGRAMEVSGTATCYAESGDGNHWTKPVMGLFSFDDSTYQRPDRRLG